MIYVFFEVSIILGFIPNNKLTAKTLSEISSLVNINLKLIMFSKCTIINSVLLTVWMFEENFYVNCWLNHAKICINMTLDSDQIVKFCVLFWKS